MERNRNTISPWTCFMIGYGVSSLIQIGIRFMDTPVDAEQVQENNRQVQLELNDQFDSSEDLILDGEDKTFEFTISQEGLPEQSCSGEYEVTEDVATITGEIACTTTIQVGDK